MATTTSTSVVGVFNSRAEADRAVDELRRMGYSNDQIGVVARDEQGQTTVEGKDTYMEEGAAGGLAAGAAAGGLIGLGVLSGVIPVIGPAIAAGTLGVILSNAAAGAAVAGLAGALIGWGIPEDEAKYYEGELKSGRYLVTVNADDRADDTWKTLHRHGAYNYSNRPR